MKRYVCGVCGWDYDEAAGDPARGIAPGTRWEDLPEGWVCPVCGAAKDEFTLAAGEAGEAPSPGSDGKPVPAEGSMGWMEMSALCSNLARGCQKQFLEEEAGLFAGLADFFASQTEARGDLGTIGDLLEEDLASGYPAAFAAARAGGDRGALRALTWGEKVARIQSGLIRKVGKEGEKALEGRVFVCEACGFLFVGEAPPAVCPVCKVPAFKFNEVQRGA